MTVVKWQTTENRGSPSENVRRAIHLAALRSKKEQGDFHADETGSRGTDRDGSGVRRLFVVANSVGHRPRLRDPLQDRHDHLAHRSRGLRVLPGCRRFQCPDRAAERRRAASTATSSRASFSTTRPVRRRWPRRPRTPSRRAPSGSSRQPAVLRGGQVPQPAGGARDRWVLRRSRVGPAALHQHVRLRRRERRPEVPGQHRNRNVHEEPRWHRRLQLRLQHLALVVAVGVRHRVVLRARRRQAGCARHLGSLRQRRHDDTGARGQAEGVQRVLRRPRRQLELRPGDRPRARWREGQGSRLPDRLRVERHQLAGLARRPGRLLRQHLPTLPAARRRHPADEVGPRHVRALHRAASSRTSASTSRGSAPIS